MKIKKLKRLTQIFLFLAIVSSLGIILVQTPSTQAWSWDTHRFIDDEAVNIFSPGSFFDGYLQDIRSASVAPDQGWGAGYWHYYDFDADGANWGESWTSGTGNLPWAIADNKGDADLLESTVNEIQSGNWNVAAENLGHLAHFTGDIGVPLHCVDNYWVDGGHTDYEGAVNDQLDNINIPSWYLPKRIVYDNENEHGSHDGSQSGENWGAWGENGENVFDYMMDATVSGYENSYGPPNPPDLNYWLKNGIFWNENIHRISEDRLRRSVHITANIWYEAFVRAGKTIPEPSLAYPFDEETISDNTPTLTWSNIDGTNYFDLQIASERNLLLKEDPIATNPQNLGSYRVVRNLTENSHTFTEPLSEDNWYWRVRSGDNSTHVGLWSDIYEFTIGQSNDSPIADFTYSPANPTDLDIIQFTDSSSDPDGTISSYEWDFENDGIIDSTSRNPTYSYPDDGNYTCVLSVTDNNGATDSYSEEIMVQNVAPSADFTYSPTQPTTEDTISFSDNSSDEDGSINYWNWDFGDGNTSTLQNPSHSYSTDGTYTVNLTVTDDDGATSNYNESFTVSSTSERSVSLSISPNEKSGSPGSTIKYSVSITNTGTVEDNYELTVNDDAEWGLFLADNSIENVPSGGEKETELTVTIPDNNSLIGKTDNIMIVSTSQENSLVKDNDVCQAVCVEDPVGGIFYPVDKDRIRNLSDEKSDFLTPYTALTIVLVILVATSFLYFWRKQ